MQNREAVERPAPAQKGVRKVKFGIVGIGQGSVSTVEALRNHPRAEVCAACDLDNEALAAFGRDFPGARTFDNFEAFLNHADMDAVFICTPNHLHAPMAQSALEHDKHVYLMKPMAMDLAAADRLVETAAARGLCLEVNTALSHGAAIKKIVEVVRSGELGRLQAIHLLKYHDWLARPRTGDESDPVRGRGGALFREGPHDFDLVRTVGGGLVRSVRGSAHVWDWDSHRPVIGSYTAFLEYEERAIATVAFSGYDRFSTRDIFRGPVSEDEFNDPSRYRQTWKKTKSFWEDDEGELALKKLTRYGGENLGQREASSGASRVAPVASGNVGVGMFLDGGILIVSCDRGDVGLTTRGVGVYGEDERREIPVPRDTGGVRTWSAAYDSVVFDEFHETIVHGAPRRHDGRWALATMEVLFAIEESDLQRKEITLSRQVGNPNYLEAE